jgi:CBS domain-containing protein
MTVFELLTDYMQPATLQDSVGDALSLALDQGHQVVPVIDEQELLVGTARLADLIAAEDLGRPLSECNLGSPVKIASDAPLFDAVEFVVDHEVDLLPVIDESGRYLGAVDLTGLLRSVSRILRIGDAGSVVEIDIPRRDYTLGQLVHTIEEHGAHVLTINSENPRNPEADVRVIVKVSLTDTVRIRAVLEHYGYNVVSIDREKSTAEDIQQRVREFMHYLDV